MRVISTLFFVTALYLHGRANVIKYCRYVFGGGRIFAYPLVIICIGAYSPYGQFFMKIKTAGSLIYRAPYFFFIGRRITFLVFL